MLEYLKKNHGNRPSINQNEKMELEFLRKEVPALREKVQQLSMSASTGTEQDGSDYSGSESEGDDVFELPIEEVKKTQAGRGPRQSVSAEAFGNWNKKEEFKAPFYEKSDDTLQALKAKLSQAFMFSNLNPEELEIVLGAMQQVSKNAGDEVIRQGDDGDNLYVVETGKLRCTKVFVSFISILVNSQKIPNHCCCDRRLVLSHSSCWTMVQVKLLVSFLFFTMCQELPLSWPLRTVSCGLSIEGPSTIS